MTFSHRIDDPEIESILAGIPHDANGKAAKEPEWADPKPLPSTLQAVKPFDPALLPASISPWAQDIADRMQCPLDYVAVPAMVALGSIVGRKIGIRPQARTDWCEVPNLWCCIIGRPGFLKSPALSEALKPMRRLEASAREASEEARKAHANELKIFKIKQDSAIAAAKKSAGRGDDIHLQELEEPPEPATRRYIATDCTYEALGEILADNPNGVLAFRDELISLLKTLDREEYINARGFFLTAWGGTSGYSFDRIGRGHIHLDAACISLLGSTQPAKIAEYIRKAMSGEGDDGLIQRFGMIVWPDHGQDWKNTDRWADSSARDVAWRTFEHLDKLSPEDARCQKDDFQPIPYLRFDDEAQEMFNDWRTNLEKSLRSGQFHPALESHFAKYRKLVPSLALISSLADGVTGRVDGPACGRAIEFARYLALHAKRLYGAGKESERTAAKAILVKIRSGALKDGFTARDITESNWSGLSDPGTVKAALEMLSDLDWLAEETEKKVGRPKVKYHINPKSNIAGFAGGSLGPFQS